VCRMMCQQVRTFRFPLVTTPLHHSSSPHTSPSHTPSPQINWFPSTLSSSSHSHILLFLPPAPAFGWSRIGRALSCSPSPPSLNDPSAGSPTDTLLRLLLPLKQGIRGSSHPTAFTVSQSQPLIICFISRSDGRCVQRAGTYSSQPDELQLQGIPRS